MKNTLTKLLLVSVFHCGATEIRTRETVLPFTRFPGVPLQPLEHRSFGVLWVADAKVGIFFDVEKSWGEILWLAKFFYVFILS